MTAGQQEIQSRGADVDEAVVNGLRELGLTLSEVDVEVLDSGSAGFLGIGGREAVVKITVLDKGEITADEDVEDIAAEAEVDFGSEPDSAPGEMQIEEWEGSGEEREDLVAQEIITSLLQRMHIEAETSIHETEPDDLTGETRWVVNVEGENLGMLIGTRGETLNALQHVARLMTGHAIRQRPTFIIDVQGYRERREQALARLADRMASKVVKRERPMTLEPMPPNERRIIHLTLRDDERVYTESVGEGRQRKVKIFPTK